MTTRDPREQFETKRHAPAPLPVHVHYHKAQKEVELVYSIKDIPPDSLPSQSMEGSNATIDQAKHTVSYRLRVELLRVFSPSAEVRGHSPDQAVLQVGKKEVALLDITAVGNYALKFVFDDGHDSGLYSWAFLYELAHHQTDWWAHYLKELEAAGASRESKGIQIKQL